LGDALAGLKLKLDTAAGRHIDNEQSDEITFWDKAQYADLERRFGDMVRPRTVACPRYNCHGMTFASRRTGIDAQVTIRQVLHEDQYGQVLVADVLPGDVILYYDDRGDVEHSGVVVETPALDPFGVPLVYSKWGKYKEMLHKANQCPYNFATAKYFRINA